MCVLTTTKKNKWLVLHLQSGIFPGVYKLNHYMTRPPTSRMYNRYAHFLESYHAPPLLWHDIHDLQGLRRSFGDSAARLALCFFCWRQNSHISNFKSRGGGWRQSWDGFHLRVSRKVLDKGQFDERDAMTVIKGTIVNSKGSGWSRSWIAQWEKPSVRSGRKTRTLNGFPTLLPMLLMVPEPHLKEKTTRMTPISLPAIVPRRRTPQSTQSVPNGVVRSEVDDMDQHVVEDSFEGPADAGFCHQLRPPWLA